MLTSTVVSPKVSTLGLNSVVTLILFRPCWHLNLVFSTSASVWLFRWQNYNSLLLKCQDQSEFFDKTSYSALDCQNINSLWASLIIEECTRLGLMVRLHVNNMVYSWWSTCFWFILHLVYLCSSRVKILSPCNCGFSSSPYHLYSMHWWAFTCLSCCWLC